MFETHLFLDKWRFIALFFYKVVHAYVLHNVVNFFLVTYAEIRLLTHALHLEKPQTDDLTSFTFCSFIKCTQSFHFSTFPQHLYLFILQY